MRRAKLAVALFLAAAASVAQADVARGDDAPRPPTAAADAELVRAKELNAQLAALSGQGRYADALPLARESLAIREKALGRDHADVATSLNKLAELLNAQGAYAEAVPLYERALAIREKALGKDHPLVATSLNNLAFLLRRQGAYAEARPLNERALAIREKALGRDHPRVATSLNNLAAVLNDQGAYAEARPLYERALAIREKALGKDHPQVATSLNNLAELLRVQGAYAEARPLYERALATYEKALGKDHPLVAASLNNLAALLQDQGAYAEARPLYERALAIREKALGKDHPQMATSLDDLAYLLHAQGAQAEARPLYERALAIREKALGKDHPDVANSHNNLAHLLDDQGAYAEARPLYERALAIREKALGKDHPRVATSLNNLAGLLANQGAYAEARPLHERALAISERALGKDHPRVATSLNNLAGLLANQGAYAEARPLLERALAINEKALGKDHPTVATSLNNLAYVLNGQGAYTEARPLHERALDIASRNVVRFLSGSTPTERTSLIASMRGTLDDWLDFTRSREPAYDGVLSFKGLAGRAGAAERRAIREAGGEARAMLDELTAAQNRLARLVHNPSAGNDEKRARWRAEVATATARVEELSLTLAGRSAAMREATGRLSLKATDIQAQLREGEVVVDLLRYSSSYAAWIVAPTGKVARVELGEASGVTATAGPIDAAAGRFRAAARASRDAADPDFVEAGRRLRALVWAPIEATLPTGTSLVYLVPDAALAAVPFAALPGREPGRFLGDERTLVHLAAAQDLVPWTSIRSTRGAGALLLGGVEHERAEATLPDDVSATAAVLAIALAPVAASGTPRAPDGPRFPPLAGTEPEIDAVAASFRAAFPREPILALRGPFASEPNLRRLAAGRRLLHLATHGFVRHDLRSALDRPAGASGAARDEGLSDGADRHLAGFDPMLLSGLALAGANAKAGGADDDGILTALEAAALDLDGTDLVTLSACDTAGGDVRAGEGVLGLCRGFREAGARCVVASLWPVEDEATRRLMARLYAATLAGDAARPPALALRQAAAALRAEEVEVLDERASSIAGHEVRVRLRAFAAPRYWAAFVAYGPIR